MCEDLEPHLRDVGAPAPGPGAAETGPPAAGAAAAGRAEGVVVVALPPLLLAQTLLHLPHLGRAEVT